jgi:hypothetical protein
VIYCGRKGDQTENTEGAIKNGQSRETDNIGYTRRRKTKQKQSRETDNIGYTRRRKKRKKTIQRN